MKKPLYKQIYDDYKKYINLGIYKPGDKLPSVREVANQMGINPNTVNRAFLMLEEENLVETLLKKGSFVKKLSNTKTEETTLLIEQIRASGITEKELNQIIKKVYGDNND